LIVACVPSFPTLPAMLVLIFIFLILLGLNHNYQHLFKKRKPRALIFIILFICLLIGSFGLELYFLSDYYYKLNHKSLEYSLELNSTSAGYELVYLPISSDAYSQNTVRVETGAGTITIIDTDYGKALLVYFKGFISISGRLDTTLPLTNYTLTLVNQTRMNESPLWDDIEYWIFYLPSNASVFSCSFEFSLSYRSEFLGTFEQCNGSLAPGWNTYWGHYGGVMAQC